MKKKLIMTASVLCSVVLLVGSAFAVQSGKVKNSNFFLEKECYNQEIQNKKPGFKFSASYSGTDYNNENKQSKSGDYIKGFILAPMVITKTICENHEIISS